MTTFTAADITTAYAKGDNIVLVTSTDETITGTFISVNSKGVNVKVGSKVVTRSLTKIVQAGSLGNDTTPDPLEEGVEYTTRDLANVFHVSAKLLRVHLRAAGLGVGRGRKYLLRKADLADVRTRLAAE